MAGVNAQGLEAANQVDKRSCKHRCNRQPTRQKADGNWTRGRMAQVLAKDILSHIALHKANVLKPLVRHVKKEE